MTSFENCPGTGTRWAPVWAQAVCRVCGGTAKRMGVKAKPGKGTVPPHEHRAAERARTGN